VPCLHAVGFPGIGERILVAEPVLRCEFGGGYGVPRRLRLKAIETASRCFDLRIHQKAGGRACRAREGEVVRDPADRKSVACDMACDAGAAVTHTAEIVDLIPSRSSLKPQPSSIPERVVLQTAPV